VCECDKDNKKRGHKLPKSGRQQPAASIDEIKSWIRGYHDDHGELPSIRIIHEELGGSNTRLMKVRETVAVELGMKAPRRPRRKEAPLAGFDPAELEPVLKKTMKVVLDTLTLQTTLAINDNKRDLMRRMDSLEQSVKKSAPDWRQDINGAVINALAGMGLTQVIAPSIQRLIRSSAKPGRKPKGPKAKAAARPEAIRPARPGRAPGKAAHDMEKLAYKRFLEASNSGRLKLLKEAAAETVEGNLTVGLALLRGCIRAAGGFQYVARKTKQPLHRLMRSFGPHGSPGVIELKSVLGLLAAIRD